MLSSSEKITSTLLEDIVFKEQRGVRYFYRDPTHQNTKVLNDKSREAYGICVDWQGSGCHNAFWLMRVSFNITYLKENILYNIFRCMWHIWKKLVVDQRRLCGFTHNPWPQEELAKKGSNLIIFRNGFIYSIQIIRYY